MTKLIRAVLLVCSILVAAVGVSAKGVPPYAVVEGDALMLYGVADEPIEVNTPPNNGIAATAWSPDGDLLAYVIVDENYQGQLMVTDLTGENPVTLASGGMALEFPIAFTPDGNIVYAAQGDVPQSEGDPYMVQLRSVSAEGESEPEAVGQFAYGVGCGGGSSFPGDWRYFTEAGFGGNDLTLEVIPAGILHSTVCGGGGLAVLDPATGEDRLIGGQPAIPTEGTEPLTISRAVVSPDGETVAAVKAVFSDRDITRSLVLIDVASSELTDIETEVQPDQLAWSPDGTLYYSTREERLNLVEGLTAEQQMTLEGTIGFIPDHIPSYTVSIRHLDPEDGDDDVVYTAEAYAIGHMEVPEPEVVVFSEVANQDAWVAGLLDGTLNPMQDPEGTAQYAAVPVTLYLLPPQTDTPVVVGENQTQFDLQT